MTILYGYRKNPQNQQVEYRRFDHDVLFSPECVAQGWVDSPDKVNGAVTPRDTSASFSREPSPAPMPIGETTAQARMRHARSFRRPAR